MAIKWVNFQNDKGKHSNTMRDVKLALNTLVYDTSIYIPSAVARSVTRPLGMQATLTLTPTPATFFFELVMKIFLRPTSFSADSRRAAVS